MFVYISEMFISEFSFFNLFNYITFRAGGATLTALFISLIFGNSVINKLKSIQPTGQPIRKDGPQDHIIKKSGTPTMGGILIISTLLISVLFWADLKNVYVWILIFSMVSFGILGFIDDYIKLKNNSSIGLRTVPKIVIQSIISLIIILMTLNYLPDEFSRNLNFPFFKNLFIDLGIFFIPFGIFIIVGSSNAVNLTDGLDGLAIVPVMIAGFAFALITYIVGNSIFASYLQITYIEGSGELAIICAALVGSSLGFLWFNAPPAMVFMGDTGSLSIGSILGTLAIIIKHEIVLAIIGGLFVFETVSVIVQVLSYKLTGKRVFQMAPLHHHFEKKGWAESTIVIRFWIIAVVLALVGLATLKIR